ncbi:MULTISPECIES: DUF983 domain-containing protein [unclassified Sphingomonas]|uniref:DUF983 domain-containing protein n=1 Tax=unclassified Sphingomonas TaxID=196159 RepID=UPI0022B34F14|nr:DUF983 domain-containing protein [Sphingomonas sp. NIBR02145]WHU01318.1 DUF983 domain-containing protein [Sphingomonas sp. NIBR02145]
MSPPPILSGTRGACPRCGAATLFRSFVGFADKCGACGLDFTRFNVGDGPVVFLTLGIGALVTGLALWVEFTFQPGLLIHALLWIPITAALVILSLRFSKGLLLALEYRNRAGEGRVREE